MIARTSRKDWGFRVEGEKPQKKAGTIVWVNKAPYRNNSAWQSKPIPKITGKTVVERSKNFLAMFWHDYNERASVAKEQKIKTEVMFCIAWADSHLWYAIKSSHNYGNVWNNDRWDTIAFKTRIDGIRAIWTMALNGRYLWHKQTIWSLSPWWGWTRPFYATSQENWNINVTNCLTLIYNKKIDEQFKFRK